MLFLVVRPGLASSQQLMPPSYRTIFPNPSGKNGYEEFVLAADLANACPEWQEYENSQNPNFDRKRTLLADPKIRQILSTLRQGLSKPTEDPRPAPDLATLPTELKAFRSVGRLLVVEMETYFADGETSKAVDCLGDGLKYGRACQTGTLMSGVVGLYIENICLSAFAPHLDQLSEGDFVKLGKIARTELTSPDVQIGLISRERDMVVRSFRKFRNDAQSLLAEVGPGPGPAQNRSDYNEVCQLVKTSPTLGPEIFDSAAVLIATHYNRTLAEFRKPPWMRSFPGPVERSSPEAKLAYSVCPPTYSNLSDRFTVERVHLQILAVHSAVQAYASLHKRLPASLAELNLGFVEKDPFTGELLEYDRMEDGNYAISSAGAYDPGNSKRPPSLTRVAIRIAYKKER
jgi:hypothetical protein